MGTKTVARFRAALNAARSRGFTLGRDSYGVQWQDGHWMPNNDPVCALGALLWHEQPPAPVAYDDDPILTIAKAAEAALGIDQYAVASLEAGWDDHPLFPGGYIVWHELGRRLAEIYLGEADEMFVRRP